MILCVINSFLILTAIGIAIPTTSLDPLPPYQIEAEIAPPPYPQVLKLEETLPKRTFHVSAKSPNDHKTSLIYRTNSVLTDEVSDASASTRVVVTIISAIDAAIIERLLTTAWALMQRKIERYGDGDVSTVTSRDDAGGLTFRAWSYFGTTMTFRCLHDAIVAIYETMKKEGIWGKGTFVIYSGGVEVGKATIDTN